MTRQPKILNPGGESEHYIAVNKHTILANAKHGKDDPPVRISRGKSGGITYCHEMTILGESQVIYNAAKPILSCGARLVIKTSAPIRVDR